MVLDNKIKNNNLLNFLSEKFDGFDATKVVKFENDLATFLKKGDNTKTDKAPFINRNKWRERGGRQKRGRNNNNNNGNYSQFNNNYNGLNGSQRMTPKRLKEMRDYLHSEGITLDRSICGYFNYPGGCDNGGECERMHICAICGRKDHGAFSCASKRTIQPPNMDSSTPKK